VAIKQLGDGVAVRLREGGVLRDALLAMTAQGTEPDDLAGGPVTVIIDAAGEAATVVACCSFALVTARVPLGRSPRWR